MVAKVKKARTGLAEELNKIKNKKVSSKGAKKEKPSGKPKSDSANKSKRAEKKDNGETKLKTPKAAKKTKTELKVLNEVLDAATTTGKADKKPHAFKHGTRSWQRVRAYNGRDRRAQILSKASVIREASDAAKRVAPDFPARVGEGTIESLLGYLEQETIEVLNLARFITQHGRPHVNGGTKAKNQAGTRESVAARLKDRGQSLPVNTAGSVTIYRDGHKLTGADIRAADIILENHGRL